MPPSEFLDRATVVVANATIEADGPFAAADRDFRAVTRGEVELGKEDLGWRGFCGGRVAVEGEGEGCVAEVKAVEGDGSGCGDWAWSDEGFCGSVAACTG